MKRISRHNFALFSFYISGLVESTLETSPSMPGLMAESSSLITDMVHDHYLAIIDPDSIVQLAEDLLSCDDQHSVGLGVFVNTKEASLSVKVMERDNDDDEPSQFDLVIYQDEECVGVRHFPLAELLKAYVPRPMR